MKLAEQGSLKGANSSKSKNLSIRKISATSGEIESVSSRVSRWKREQKRLNLLKRRSRAAGRKRKGFTGAAYRSFSLMNSRKPSKVWSRVSKKKQVKFDLGSEDCSHKLRS